MDQVPFPGNRSVYICNYFPIAPALLATGTARSALTLLALDLHSFIPFPLPHGSFRFGIDFCQSTRSSLTADYLLPGAGDQRHQPTTTDACLTQPSFPAVFYYLSTLDVACDVIQQLSCEYDRISKHDPEFPQGETTDRLFYDLHPAQEL